MKQGYVVINAYYLIWCRVSITHVRILVLNRILLIKSETECVNTLKIHCNRVFIIMDVSEKCNIFVSHKYELGINGKYQGCNIQNKT